ncbi:hypothetical protein [Brevundimonas sp.]|uniref:hypothetical protein n=1 Tax=Brevundimonas sp. TaxID=1871086 RepID=UPI002FC7CDF0
MLKLVGLTTAMVLVATAASAQVAAKPLPEGRLCTYEDVVGVWDSKVVSAEEAGVERFAAAFPRDYMRFKPGGEMMYIASNSEIASVSEVHSRLDAADSVDGAEYNAAMVSAGVLILFQNGNPFQGFTCTVVEPRDGRAVTIFSELEGMPALHRVQFKLD